MQKLSGFLLKEVALNFLHGLFLGSICFTLLTSFNIDDSLTLIASEQKKNNIRFMAVIDHLVRSGWEFLNTALLRWALREFSNLHGWKSGNLLVILP